MLPCVAGLLLLLPPALNQGLDRSLPIQKRQKHTLAAFFPLPSASLLKMSDYSRAKDRRANVICSSNVIGLSCGILRAPPAPQRQNIPGPSVPLTLPLASCWMAMWLRLPVRPAMEVFPSTQALTVRRDVYRHREQAPGAADPRRQLP